MNEPSKLPAAQQVRREALQQAEAARTGTSTEVAPTGTVVKPTLVAMPTAVTEPVVPAVAPTPTAPTGPSISEQELKDLRAKAEDAVIAQRKLEKAEMELREAEARLTELERLAKASSSPAPAAPVAPSAPAPSTLRLAPTDTDLSEDEAASYSEATPVIVKVARKQIAELVNPLLDALEQRLIRLESGVTTATTAATQVAANSFVERVKAEVGPAKFGAIIAHPKWKDFAYLDMPGAGVTYGKAIENAHLNQNLKDMAFIFDTFANKYKDDLAADPAAGYSGISMTGTQGAPVDSSQPQQKRLKYSDRKKASEDRVKGRITAEELAAIRKEFDKAEAAGLVDYDN